MVTPLHAWERDAMRSRTKICRTPKERVMANWYVSSAGWTNVTAWAASTAYNIGDIRRQLASTVVGNERVWRCTTAGTSGSSEPAWSLTQGSATSDNTVVWTEITGQEAYQGTSWAAPHARLASAFGSGWAAAGDTVFVSSDHAETQAAPLTMTATGTATNANRILCVGRPSSAIPPGQADITTGASVTTTGNNAIDLEGCFYCYGVTFSSGSGANAPGLQANINPNTLQIFDTCTLQMSGTAGGNMAFGAGLSTITSTMTLRNTNISLGAASSAIVVRGTTLTWTGGALQGTAPNQLFGGAGAPSNSSTCDIRDADLSLVGASQHLVNLTNVVGPCAVKFTNCKLATTLGGVTTGTASDPTSVTVDLIVSDSTNDVLVREEHYQYAGSVVQDTTNYRTGGASDGTTTKSWRMVSLSTSRWEQPLYGPDIFQWVPSTGSKTITLFVANTSAALKDNELGFEVEYLGSATTPLGTYASTLSGVLAAGSNLATDTSTWNGLVSPTNQKVTKTPTFNQTGWVRVRPVLAKPSATVWVDPSILVA